MNKNVNSPAASKTFRKSTKYIAPNVWNIGETNLKQIMNLDIIHFCQTWQVRNIYSNCLQRNLQKFETPNPLYLSLFKNDCGDLEHELRRGPTDFAVLGPVKLVSWIMISLKKALVESNKLLGRLCHAIGRTRATYVIVLKFDDGWPFWYF